MITAFALMVFYVLLCLMARVASVYFGDCLVYTWPYENAFEH
jgi:hypothetical protein